MGCIEGHSREETTDESITQKMKVSRKYDYCNEVTHFTKGDICNPFESAYQNFSKIVNDQMILGNTSNIRSGDQVICFTESPYHCLKNNGELNPEHFQSYMPFGFQISKQQLYLQSGRPVIYSNYDEFDLLNADAQWRHVDYQPNFLSLEEQRQNAALKYANYSWQREWRIKQNILALLPHVFKLVLPNDYWIKRFLAHHATVYHDPSCPQCNCQQDAQILNFSDYFDPVTYEVIQGTCPVPTKFKWIIVNMNGSLNELDTFYRAKCKS